MLAVQLDDGPPKRSQFFSISSMRFISGVSAARPGPRLLALAPAALQRLDELSEVAVEQPGRLAEML
jgi:hypothetical protein